MKTTTDRQILNNCGIVIAQIDPILPVVYRPEMFALNIHTFIMMLVRFLNLIHICNADTYAGMQGALQWNSRGKVGGVRPCFFKACEFRRMLGVNGKLDSLPTIVKEMTWNGIVVISTSPSDSDSSAVIACVASPTYLWVSGILSFMTSVGMKSTTLNMFRFNRSMDRPIAPILKMLSRFPRLNIYRPNHGHPYNRKACCRAMARSESSDELTLFHPTYYNWTMSVVWDTSLTPAIVSNNSRLFQMIIAIANSLIRFASWIGWAFVCHSKFVSCTVAIVFDDQSLYLVATDFAAQMTDEKRKHLLFIKIV